MIALWKSKEAEDTYVVITGKPSDLTLKGFHNKLEFLELDIIKRLSKSVLLAFQQLNSQQGRILHSQITLEDMYIG